MTTEELKQLFSEYHYAVYTYLGAQHAIFAGNTDEAVSRQCVKFLLISEELKKKILEAFEENGK